MPSMTVLDMVQKILSSMDGDEVNSINDTLEATQVAEVIETTYYNIVNGKDWPHLFEMFTLTPSGTTARPTHMSLPDSYQEIRWLKYNKRTSTDTKDMFLDVIYLEPKEFMEVVNPRDETLSTVDQITDDVSGVVIKIVNDTAPTYYTSFDHENLIFDSYDSGVENTLTAARTQCYGKKEPTFTVSDSFVPDLPTSMFSYLLNEAKAVAFVEVKQTQNPKAEQHSVTQRRRLSQDSWRLNGGIKYASFGRTSKK